MRNLLRRRKAASVFVAIVVVVLGTSVHGQPQSSSPASAIHFEDVTRTAGIKFIHNNGAFGKKYLPETMGSGVAFIDYDNDGWPDILLVNGTDWPGHAPAPHDARALSQQSRRHVHRRHPQSRPGGRDVWHGRRRRRLRQRRLRRLFITAIGQSHLFHNNGNGTFTDVTKKAGLVGPNEFSTSAAWVDYDRDGHLDLVVANYVQWTPETDLYCTLDGKAKSYCTPESYKGTSVRLWHNRGDGTFEDVTQKAGLFDPTSKSLGVAVLDYEQRWLARYSDQPMTRSPTSSTSTTAMARSPKKVSSPASPSAKTASRAPAWASMRPTTIAPGYPSLIITNFCESDAFALPQRRQRPVCRRSAAIRSRPRHACSRSASAAFSSTTISMAGPTFSLPMATLKTHIERVQKRVKYAEPPHLFRNLGSGKFEEVTARCGRQFRRAARRSRRRIRRHRQRRCSRRLLSPPTVALPCSSATTGATNHSLRIKLEGTKSNRDGIGAVVQACRR